MNSLPRNSLPYNILAEPPGAGASRFVARARQQGSDCVAGLSASCALPGLPFSSTFGLCPPTPWTTPGAQAGSRGTRASTRARGKAFQPAQFPSRIVGDLPQAPCPGSSGHGIRVQPESHTPASLAVSSWPHRRLSRPQVLHLPGVWSPLRAFTHYEHSTAFLSISISRLRNNPRALAPGFILLVDVAEEMKHPTFFFSPEGNSNITPPNLPVNPAF